MAGARPSVRFVVGEHDEHYGAEPDRASYDQLVSLYTAQGLDADESARLAVLDVKPDFYFSSRGVSDQHGAGAALLARAAEILKRLFAR